MQFHQGKVYIGAGGVFVFENEELKYFDVFAQFKNQISSKYKIVLDFDIEENKFYIATSAGIIYSDDFFTDVKEENAVRELSLYPNILNAGKEIILESNKFSSIQKIKVFNSAGAAVGAINNFDVNFTGRSNLEIPALSSGHYYLLISTNTGDYTAPFIIQK